MQYRIVVNDGVAEVDGHGTLPVQSVSEIELAVAVANRSGLPVALVTLDANGVAVEEGA